jgi:hypothetical protein
VPELPQDDQAGEDLDDGVEPEPDQCDRSGGGARRDGDDRLDTL